MTITDDDIYEGDEYFTLSVVDPPGFESFTKTITIQDNNEGMCPCFARTSAFQQSHKHYYLLLELDVQVTDIQYNILESSDFVTIGFTLTAPAGGLAIPVTFTITFLDITATGGDYSHSIAWTLTALINF